MSASFPRERFPTWDGVLRARTSTIADTIRSGGLAEQKASVIKTLLKEIEKEHGSLDLGFLHDLPASLGTRYLARFRGIGPKTVACTLLLACGKEIFPLDSHILRIVRRVGLIPPKCSDVRAHEIMSSLVPRGKFYSLHVNLINLGRTICRPREPMCGRCPIVEYCNEGQSKI